METQSVEFRRELVTLLPRLRRFARALTGGVDAGEDLLQSAVERALVHAGAYERGRRLDSWMYKIMQNLWFDMKRGAVQNYEFANEAFDTFGEDGRAIVEARDDLRRAREAFARLPSEQRAVMNLVVLEGMAYAEAAEALDVPIGTIMSRLARARASVAAHVRGTAEIEPVRKRH
jgi:RNA polymerase sigma-70 factor, ECF subfamily